jgi:hypothetical protein
MMGVLTLFKITESPGIGILAKFFVSGWVSSSEIDNGRNMRTDLPCVPNQMT